MLCLSGFELYSRWLLLPNLKFVDSQSSTLLTNTKHLVHCSMPWVLALYCQGDYEGDNESVSETLHTGQIVLSCPTIYHATFISP